MARMVIGTIGVLMSALLPLPSRVAQGQSPSANAIVEREAYAVYFGLAKMQWPASTTVGKKWVFQKETHTAWRCVPTGQPVHADWRSVVESYKIQNAESRALQPEVLQDPAFIVLSSADIQRIRGEAQDPRSFGWDAFERRYPNSDGYIRVSAIGFNPSKTRAMVTMENICGAMCGGGAHHTLQKVADNWRDVTVPGLVNNCRWNS